VVVVVVVILLVVVVVVVEGTGIRELMRGMANLSQVNQEL